MNNNNNNKSVSFVSVIMPTYNEEKYISCCLDSLIQQDYQKEHIEILVLDGMSTDETRSIVSTYSLTNPHVKLIDNPKKIFPVAMNLGIEKSKGEYIIMLGAHSEYPSNYVSLLMKYAKEYNTDVVGGVSVIEVKNKTNKTLAIKAVLSHRFGVGNSTFRIGVSKPEVVDTVPSGCYKRNVFERFGLFDERLVRNQDIELNKRISNGGGKILLVPEVEKIYFARETFLELMKNNYGNGFWIMLTVAYTRSFKSLSVRHYIPLLFICSLIFPLILSLIYYPLILLSIFSLFLYLSFLLTISFKISITSKLNFGYLVLSFMSLHFSYGWGSLVGGVKKLISKL